MRKLSYAQSELLGWIIAIVLAVALGVVVTLMAMG